MAGQEHQYNLPVGVHPERWQRVRFKMVGDTVLMTTKDIHPKSVLKWYPIENQWLAVDEIGKQFWLVLSCGWFKGDWDTMTVRVAKEAI